MTANCRERVTIARHGPISTVILTAASVVLMYTVLFCVAQKMEMYQMLEFSFDSV